MNQERGISSPPQQTKVEVLFTPPSPASLEPPAEEHIIDVHAHGAPVKERIQAAAKGLGENLHTIGTQVGEQVGQTAWNIADITKATANNLSQHPEKVVNLVGAALPLTPSVADVVHAAQNPPPAHVQYYGEALPSQHPIQTPKGELTIPATAVPKPTNFRGPDGGPPPQKQEDVDRHIVDAIGGIAGQLNAITYPETPTTSKEVLEQQGQPFPIYTVDLGSLNSLDVRKFGDLTSVEHQTIVNNPTYQQLLAVHSEVIDYLSQALGKASHEFKIAPDVFRTKDGNVLMAAVDVHLDANGMTDMAFLYAVEAGTDGAPKAVIAAISIPPEQRGKMRVGLALQKGIRLVPVVYAADGTILSVVTERQSTNSPDTQRAQQPTPTPPINKDTVQFVSLDLSQKGQALPAGGEPAGNLPDGISKEVYDAAYKKAFADLPIDLEPRTKLAETDENFISYDYKRDGFVDKKNRIWRVGMSRWNDVETGWLTETDRRTYTFKYKGKGKDIHLTVVDELNPDLAVGDRKYKNIQFGPDFDQQFLGYAADYFDASFDGKTIYTQWVSQYDNKDFSVDFVTPLQGMPDGRTISAYGSQERGNTIFLRIYSMGSPNKTTIEDDTKWLTYGLIEGYELAALRKFGKPSYNVFVQEVPMETLKKMAQKFYLKSGKPANLLILSTTPPAAQETAGNPLYSIHKSSINSAVDAWAERNNIVSPLNPPENEREVSRQHPPAPKKLGI